MQGLFLCITFNSKSLAYIGPNKYLLNEHIEYLRLETSFKNSVSSSSIFQQPS